MRHIKAKLIPPNLISRIPHNSTLQTTNFSISTRRHMNTPQREQMGTYAPPQETIIWNGQRMKKLPTTFSVQHRQQNGDNTVLNAKTDAYYSQLNTPSTQKILSSDSPTNPTFALPPVSYHLLKNVNNPFTSLKQRISFLITPLSEEHRNHEPFLNNFEKFLNRKYNRLKRYVLTRSTVQKAQLVVYAAIFYLIANYAYERYKLPRLIHIENYEFKPELPEKHIPYRSALLPHTLPTHLSGTDSLFVTEVGYDKSQVERGDYIRVKAPPKMGFGRTPSRSYLDVLSEDGGIVERDSQLQKPYRQKSGQKPQELLDDVPPKLDKWMIQPNSPYFNPKEKPPPLL